MVSRLVLLSWAVMLGGCTFYSVFFFFFERYDFWRETFRCFLFVFFFPHMRRLWRKGRFVELISPQLGISNKQKPFDKRYYRLKENVNFFYLDKPMNLNPVTIIFHMKFSFAELLARLKREKKKLSYSDVPSKDVLTVSIVSLLCGSYCSYPRYAHCGKLQCSVTEVRKTLQLIYRHCCQEYSPEWIIGPQSRWAMKQLYFVSKLNVCFWKHCSRWWERNSNIDLKCTGCYVTWSHSEITARY